MSSFARAVVYPLARAIADAYFEARATYDRGIEEKRTPDDERRAGNLRAAVERVQPVPAGADNTRPGDTAPRGGGIDGNGVGPAP